MLNSYKTKLIVKQYLTRDVWLFRFQLQESSELHFIAGQYMILLIPQNTDASLRRLYSIASSERQIDSFELIIKLVDGGIGSAYLAKIQIGDLVDFQGPAGQFALKENNNSKIFLATGTGIAPMLSMIDKLVNPVTPSLRSGHFHGHFVMNIHSSLGLHPEHSGYGVNPKSEIRNPKQILNFNEKNSKQNNIFRISSFEFRIFLFWGLATYQDVFYLDRLKQIKKENPNFDFKIRLSREKDLSMIKPEDKQFFFFGHINNCVNTLHVSRFALHDSNFYICGRREMVEGLRTELEGLGVEKEKIYFERF